MLTNFLLEDQGIVPLEVVEAREVRKILEEKEFGFLCQLHSKQTISRAITESLLVLCIESEAEMLTEKVAQGAARYLVEKAGLDWPDPTDSWSSWVSKANEAAETADL